MTKKRTYTVQRLLDGNIPYILIRGKWLRELQLDLGSMVEMEEIDGKMILTKMPDEEVEQLKLQRERKRLEKQLQLLKKALLDSHS
jgi:transposase-like protein